MAEHDDAPVVEPVETTDPDSATAVPETPGADRVRARRVALLSLRLVAGTVAVVAAAATVAVVGLVPLPSLGAEAPEVEVTPVPADEVRACAGATLRLGDETGADADRPVPIGVPSVRADAINAPLQSSSISTSDAGNGGQASAPEVLRIESAEGAEVVGAQSQVVDANNFRGYAAAACAEPSGSIWLVGGATTVGRTSILTIANPTDVAAQVELTIYGEEGEIDAPGMKGIEVAPGAQRVLSVAGFAPGLLSPVVHVEARGGQVVAFLQQSIVRGLDATGLDLVDAAPDPANELTVPGVQIFDSIGTNRALSLEDWDDVAPVVRILNPGTVATEVTVSVTPLDPAVTGTSFPVQAEPGVVTDVALDSGLEAESGVALADGIYTVTMAADQPILGGVRTSAAADIGPVNTEGPVAAPASDLAWYSAATALDGDTLVTVAPGPAPKLVAVNPSGTEVAMVLDAGGGEDLTLVVPAGGAASIDVVAGTSYTLREAAGLSAAVSYASDDRMGAYPVTPARPVSGPITIRP